MKTLNELKTFLTSQKGVKIIRTESKLLEFGVNHESGLTRKQLLQELYKYSGYKLKSTGSNTGDKQYIVYID